MAGGGAWKVAYADFVTALFALFLVLWIMGQDEEEKGTSSANFRDPWQTITQKSTRIIKVREDNVISSRESHFIGDSPVPFKFQQVREEEVIKTFMNNKELRDNRSIKVKQVNEGVLISFFDNSSNEPMFEDKLDPENKPILTERGLTSLRTVGWLIARYNMDGGKGSDIEINSHTEKDREDPWGMSAKQATLVFEELVNVGVKETQVVKIAGLGDATPMMVDDIPLKPDDERNRRFEILIRTKPESH
jgi:chemotaxis protein MotB